MCNLFLHANRAYCLTLVTLDDASDSATRVSCFLPPPSPILQPTMPMSSPVSSPSSKTGAFLKAYPSSPHSAPTFASNSNKSSDMDVDAFPKANTSSSTNNTVDTPNTSISSTGASDGQKRVVAKIIAESFPPFNHQAVAVGPYEEEQKRDIEYNQGEYFLFWSNLL